MYDNYRDEIYLRRVIMLLEVFLISYKRFVVKDSVVNVICYGVKFMISGLFRFENDIEVGEEVVLMMIKGEVIVLGIVEMITVVMVICDYGIVVKIKRVIMDRDIYSRKWGFGLRVSMKKKLIVEGKLNKNGKLNENIFVEWVRNVVFFIGGDFMIVSFVVLIEFVEIEGKVVEEEVKLKEKKYKRKLEEFDVSSVVDGIKKIKVEEEVVEVKEKVKKVKDEVTEEEVKSEKKKKKKEDDEVFIFDVEKLKKEKKKKEKFKDKVEIFYEEKFEKKKKKKSKDVGNGDVNDLFVDVDDES